MPSLQGGGDRGDDGGDRDAPRCPACAGPMLSGSVDKRDGRFKCTSCVRRGIVNQAGVFVMGAGRRICNLCNGLMQWRHRGMRSGDDW